MAESFSMEIPSDVLALMEVLENAGYETYVVGGCVRDAMLGRTPHDYDMCTSATPTQIKEAMRAAGYKTYDTGIQHGTISVNNNDELYEITTFRIDGEYSDGRHPDSVTFTTNLIEDLSRRDFTINAMAYSYKVGLIDPFEGGQDIDKQIIRCVGNPSERLAEDALRILRAMRLSTKYGFTIEPMTMSAMEETKSMLDLIAPERIQAELIQYFSFTTADALDMSRNILAKIIPEVELTYDFPEDMYCKLKDFWKFTAQTVEEIWEDVILRVAAFLQNLGRPCVYEIVNGQPTFHGHCQKTLEIAESVLTNLKFDNKSKKDILDILRFQDKPITKDPAVLKAVMNQIGHQNTNRLIQLLIANTKAYQKIRYLEIGNTLDWKDEEKRISEKIKQLYAAEVKVAEVVINKEPYRLQDLAVKGNDIIELGVSRPQDIGIVLNNLLKDVLKHPEHNTKAFLLDKAEKELSAIEKNRDSDFTLFTDAE
jgi:tRNA nucleotidyltransferase (CCA-adding enzyme)